MVSNRANSHPARLVVAVGGADSQRARCRCPVFLAPLFAPETPDTGNDELVSLASLRASPRSVRSGGCWIRLLMRLAIRAWLRKRCGTLVPARLRGGIPAAPSCDGHAGRGRWSWRGQWREGSRSTGRRRRAGTQESVEQIE